jgi:hypothetical protein
MMTQSGNFEYNGLIGKIKLNDRKDPRSSLRIPYTYMISVEDRLGKFLQRMSDVNPAEESQSNLDGIIR